MPRRKRSSLLNLSRQRETGLLICQHSSALVAEPLEIPISSILDQPHNHLKGAVLIGFTHSGNHLISYTSSPVPAADGRAGYHLQLWEFHPFQPAQRVINIPLFQTSRQLTSSGGGQLFSDALSTSLGLTVACAPDDRVLIVHGQPVELAEDEVSTEHHVTVVDLDGRTYQAVHLQYRAPSRIHGFLPRLQPALPHLLVFNLLSGIVCFQLPAPKPCRAKRGAHRSAVAAAAAVSSAFATGQAAASDASSTEATRQHAAPSAEHAVQSAPPAAAAVVTAPETVPLEPSASGPQPTDTDGPLAQPMQYESCMPVERFGHQQQNGSAIVHGHAPHHSLPSAAEAVAAAAAAAAADVIRLTAAAAADPGNMAAEVSMSETEAEAAPAVALPATGDLPAAVGVTELELQQRTVAARGRFCICLDPAATSGDAAMPPFGIRGVFDVEPFLYAWVKGNMPGYALTDYELHIVTQQPEESAAYPALHASAVHGQLGSVILLVAAACSRPLDCDPTPAAEAATRCICLLLEVDMATGALQLLKVADATAQLQEETRICKGTVDQPLGMVARAHAAGWRHRLLLPQSHAKAPVVLTNASVLRTAQSVERLQHPWLPLCLLGYRS